MRRTSALLAAILGSHAPHLAWAQAAGSERIILEDRFVDNRNNWPLGEKTAADKAPLAGEEVVKKVSIVRNHLIIEGRKPGLGNWALLNVHMDPEADFVIEATMQLTRKGPTLPNDSFGLVFALSGAESYYEFLIRPGNVQEDAQYCFLRRENGTWREDTGWVSTTAIRVGGANTLAVRKNQGKFFLDINGTNVDKVPAFAVPAFSWLGVVTNDAQTVETTFYRVVESTRRVADRVADRPVERAQEPVKEIVKESGGQKGGEPGKRVVVAVFDVEDSNPKANKQTLANLAEYLAALLTKKGSFSVVPREQLRTQMGKSKEASYHACYDSACQIELGKAVAAEALVSTKILRIGDTCAVTSTLFDLKKEAAQKAATTEVACSEKALLGAIRTISEQL